MKFFGVIIGSEILDGRREDSHFKFLRDELKERGWSLSGVYIIEDNPELMAETYRNILEVKNSVIFSFGGIGATPDDHTRRVSAEVFQNGEMEFQQEFLEKIFKKFGVENSKNRINMSYLPKGAELLYNNPVNGMCGFYLQKRFFFVPGFPEMAHPMIREALDLFYPQFDGEVFYRSVKVEASEGVLIDWMERLPKEITLSSLPKLNRTSDGKLQPVVDIRIGASKETILEGEMEKLIKFLEESEIDFVVEEE
jgi:molybdopterin-biosynthesis enzyme MoeA-like protein